MLNVNIDDNEYDTEINTLRPYYGMKGKDGKPLIVRNPDHTITISKSMNPLFVQYILSCLGPMLNPNKNCMMIAGAVWNQRRIDGNIAKLKNYKTFARAFNTMNASATYSTLENQISKSDIVLPDFQYFFENSRYISYAEDKLSEFTDEFAQALDASVSRNNQITPNLLVPPSATNTKGGK